MREGKEGLEIASSELAESAYRVWCNITGDGRELGDCPGDVQERWLRACRWAKLGLLSFDGKPVAEAVSVFVSQWCDGDETMRRSESAAHFLEWEAVVRHLSVLIDSDELEGEDDVLALEKTWASWVKRHKEKT